jgi:hypothetical protein
VAPRAKPGERAAKRAAKRAATRAAKRAAARPPQDEQQQRPAKLQVVETVSTVYRHPEAVEARRRQREEALGAEMVAELAAKGELLWLE